MKNIVRAVFTLSAFTILERILGFFFKIYLSRRLGAEAMGVYQVSFSFFMVLLTLTSSGLPLIVSKLTAKCRAENNLRRESAVSSAALIVSTTISIVASLVIIALSRPLGRLFADERSKTLLLLMLPSLVFSAIYSALRGNLWGRKKYTVVSLLELAEQFARIGACIILFALGFDKLRAVAVSLSVGCAVAAAICAVVFFANGAKLSSPRGQLVPLIRASSPITAARAATSLTGSLIAIAVPFLLTRAGSDNAMYEFGYSMGMAIPLLYIPLTIVGSLAFVMIPTLSEAMACGNSGYVKRQVDGALRMSLVAGALFFPLFYALGEPIGTLVYGSADAGAFLSFAAWLLVPISIESITSSMMNSLDMEMRGLINYFVGTAFMFSVFFMSGRHFSVRIMSIGMGVSWLVSSALNLFAMRKKVGLEFSFLLPFLLTAALAVPTVFLTRWLYNILSPLRALLRILTAGSAGLLFITVLCFLFGVIRGEMFVSGKKQHACPAPKGLATLSQASQNSATCLNPKCTTPSTYSQNNTASSPSAISPKNLVASRSNSINPNTNLAARNSAVNKYNTVAGNRKTP